MTFTTTTRSLVATAAMLALPLCQGFSPVGPTTTTTTSTTASALHAHARRTHTYAIRSALKSSNSPRTVFDEMDKDGNGKVDAQELTDYLKEAGPYTDAVSRSIFERLDVNRDGHLELEELAQGMKHHKMFLADVRKDTKIPIKAKTHNNHKKPNNKKNTKRRRSYSDLAQKFFDTLDANRDGSISMQELKEHFLAQRMQVVAQSSGLLESLKGGKKSSNNKANKANNASAEKAWHSSEAAVQKLFQAIDVNDDGRISIQELREAFETNPSVRHAFL